MDSNAVIFVRIRYAFMELIFRKDKVFVHTGIVLNNKVYHFSSLTNSFFDMNKVIHCNKIGEFSLGRPIKVYNLPNCEEDSLKRLNEFLEQHKKYNLIFNNCYSLVLYTIKGKYSILNLIKLCIKYKIFIISIFNIHF